MHKNATKCNETLSKWCKNKHGSSKIMDTLETYHAPMSGVCWIGWYSVTRTHAFIPTIWFRRERREAPFFVPIIWLVVHGEVRGGEYHEGQIRGLAMEVRVSALLRDLLGVLVSQQYESGDISTCEVRSFTFQDKNPRSGLNWLCLTMILLKVLFWERGLFSGWKPKIFDRMTTTLVHYSLLEDIAFGEPRVQLLSWWCLYCCC
jgi:hypothetical protein